MLIREIIIKNFLTLYGEQKIKFPAGTGHSTALILGSNNSGKSSFVKALQFLLHQRLPGCNEETAWSLINNRHRDETEIREECAATVTATFVYGEKKLTIRRSIRSRRRGKGKENFGDAAIDFSYLQESSTSNKFVADKDGTIQRKLEVLCPDQLLEAFFFTGEPLDGKLLRGVKQVRESLEEYLSIRQWEGAASAARELRSHYASEKQKLAQKNRELDAILREETQIQTRVDEKRHSKAQLETLLQTQREELEQRQSAILSIANQSEMRADVEERDRLQFQLEREQQLLDTAKGQICDEIGRSAGYPFLLPFVGKARDILSKLYAEGILPAELAPDFVKRVLTREECICGQKHNNQTRAAWRKYLERTLDADVSSKLKTLEGRLNEAVPNSLQKTAAAIIQQIREAITQDSASKIARNALEGSIATLTQRIQQSPVEELRKLETERKKLDVSVKATEQRLKTLEIELKGLAAEHKRTKEQRSKMKIDPDVDRRVKEIECHQTTANDLAELVDGAIEALRRQFHKNLQHDMSQTYDENVTDKTTAVVSPTTLLPSIMQNGTRVMNLGGGQSQLLGLSFITSVARLRNSLHKGMNQLGIKLGVVGDQSFVLDCPFSGMERHYIEAAVEGLRSAAKQVIFLLHGSQWLAAKQFLEPFIDVAWGVHMHASRAIIQKLKPEDRTYKFHGKSIVLAAESSADGEAIFSEIEPLK